MKKFTLFFSIAAVLGFYGTVQAAYFMGLGDLPGGIFGSRAYAVSADGSVVVGGSYSSVVGGSDSSNIYKAFRWTLEEGMVSLAGVPSENVGTEASFVSADGSVVVGLIYINPDPFVFHLTKHGDLEVVAPSGGDVPYIEATGISTDGSVIVGANHANANWCPCGDFQCVEAFRWTQDGGKVGLGTLPSACHSGATGVSADGSIVVGNAYLTSSTEAFRWTEEEGMLGLGYLPGGFDSYAYAVSADGSVVVGDSSLSKGIEAFRWTQDGGMVGLGKLSGDEFAISSAYAISEDGSVVYGNSDSYYGSEVFRWTQESGMVGISPGYFRFISSDGSVVISSEWVQDREIYWIWDSTNGTRNLEDVLTSNGADLTGWQNILFENLSADGKTIVGYGTNPDGNREACIAYLKDDTDGDGILDVEDKCPIENSTGFDADGNGCIDSADSLPELIIDLGITESGLESGLLDKAVEVKEKIDFGKIKPACKQLDGMIYQTDWQRKFFDPLEDADMLIEFLQNIQDKLGC